MRAKKDGTTIFRLDNKVFREFLDPSRIKQWYDKEVESRFPDEVRFATASKKVKEQIFNSMSLRVFEPNEVMLKAGTMPNDLLFLVKGRIQLL